MKCPFIIPVEKIDDYQGRRGKKYYRIIDVAKCTIVEGISEELADFLVIATNSHEKLVEALETFPDVHLCTCNCDVCVWFRTKARPIREALKEAGEPK